MSEDAKKQATEFPVPQGPHYEFPGETGMNKPEKAEIVPANVTPMDLLQVAMSNHADLDRLEKLMDLHFRWQAKEAEKQFDAAMVAFKSEAPEILRNKHVKFGQTEYDHATLDQVCEPIIEALSKHGITHRWKPTQAEGLIRITCILKRAGHSEETSLESAPDNSGGKNSIQAIASAVTYLERYTLLAATGLAVKNGDNDGAGAEPLPTLQLHIDRIKAAPDAAALERAYKDAVKAALEAKNTGAMNHIVKAKDDRKKVLANETAA